MKKFLVALVTVIGLGGAALCSTQIRRRRTHRIPSTTGGLANRQHRAGLSQRERHDEARTVDLVPRR
jgi:hypothetical protein